MGSPTPPSPAPRWTRRRWAASLALGGLALWLFVAYLFMPDFWKHWTRRHPALEDLPGVTFTPSGLPADPINVALVGTRREVLAAMLAAKWYPADPLTLRSCLEMAEAAALKREYDDAPVSTEFLYGRKQDLAFEQAVGDNPRHRHHVRFWQSDQEHADGRPIWVGSAVYDERVGLSRTTGQFTHKTAPDVDAERDILFKDLQAAGDLQDRIVVPDFHKVREGRNGQGNPWFTDGSLYLGVLQPGSARSRAALAKPAP